MATAAIAGIVAGVGAGLGGASVLGAVVLGGLAFAGTAAQEMAAEERQEAAQAAAAEAKKQRAINNAQQNIARQRAIRRSIAEARVRRAELEARGFGGGPVGAGQAITGDTASAIGAANTQAGAQFGISQSQNREAQFLLESRSQNGFDRAASLFNFAGTAFNTYRSGGFEGIGDFFSTPSTSTSQFNEGAVYGGR